MPLMGGFELQEVLRTNNPALPILFLTGHGTIPMSVRAIKGGAYEFLTKPVESAALIDAIESALRLAENNAVRNKEHYALKQRHMSLTPREHEVLQLAISGLLNKQIAAELGVSEITVKVHRRRVMEKMQVRSVAELVRVVERLSKSLPTE